MCVAISPEMAAVFQASCAPRHLLPAAPRAAAAAAGSVLPSCLRSLPPWPGAPGGRAAVTCAVCSGEREGACGRRLATAPI